MQQEWFVKVAPYLRDPLILIGFFLFLSFLFVRAVVKRGLIPILTQEQGYGTLKTILLYGFVLGLALIILGFGLKYRELSQSEQKNLLSLVQGELHTNLHVVSELEENTKTLSNAAFTVANILRDPRLKIMSGVFPKENIDPPSDFGDLADLYNKRVDWLTMSNLLDNPDEVSKYQQACAAIVRTIDKTLSTVISLSDPSEKRYVIQTQVRDANLNVFRKITYADVTPLSQLYEKISRTRTEYNRIAAAVPEYLVNVRSFCLKPLPERSELSATLASERLSLALLKKYRDMLQALAGEINLAASKLQL